MERLARIQSDRSYVRKGSGERGSGPLMTTAIRSWHAQGCFPDRI